jgi:hypothetical protein
MESEIAALTDRLDAELQQEIERTRRRADQAHWLATILMALGIIASFAAGLLGLTKSLDASQVGALALLPGAIGIFGGAFKPDKRASWHYRKADALRMLRDKLIYSLPLPPTPEKIDALIKERAEGTTSMQEEWDELFVLDWTGILKPHARVHTPNPRGRTPSQ